MHVLWHRLYVLQQSYCQYTTKGYGAEITGYVNIASGNEQHLQAAVAYVGPTSVAVDASSTAFRVSYGKWRQLMLKVDYESFVKFSTLYTVLF